MVKSQGIWVRALSSSAAKMPSKRSKVWLHYTPVTSDKSKSTKCVTGIEISTQLVSVSFQGYLDWYWYNTFFNDTQSYRQHNSERPDYWHYFRESQKLPVPPHITEDLTWDKHTGQVVKKAKQQLFHTRQLKKFGMWPEILWASNRGTTESILTACITAWHGNCTADQRHQAP